ncbi:MAG: hypothetical protein E8D46_17735 [Nitrospira sp.]|nr:MAG: hypothetical protein E8D46_17735 [Nitrospira sp.]
MPKSDLKKFKLFPRNLTARADALVRGNPVTSRPESGVENCFPGLEFDQRNIDSGFFPGLQFEMHHTAGVVLRDFDNSAPAAAFLRRTDIQQGIFLAYVQGVFASRMTTVAPAPRVVRFTPPAGLESWRFVRDLEVGEIAVVLCDRQAFSRVANGNLDIDVVTEWLKKRENREENLPGIGRFVLLFGERVRFLTSNGVIDPDSIEPGQLTQSLCSPWQYDFADCGCFYWASNKPDLVSNDAQPEQVLNFQRKDRSEGGDRATTADDWVLKHENLWDGDSVIVRHAEMLTWWADLPFVIRRRETDRYEPTIVKPPKKPLDRVTIIDRLSRLASVEHALAIEYLYAYYSLGLPPTRPPGLGTVQACIYTAGTEIFQVAIDEMRHLRAVNEILIELGAPWQLDRADIIGEDFDGDGVAFQRPFALRPLDRTQLGWFIAVEAASQNQGDENTIDGMYTLILRSVAVSDEFSADQKNRLSALIKVIIDEGIDHYARFSRAKTALAGIPENEYLKVQTGPETVAAGHPDSVLQDAADAAYLVVLRSLDYVFQVGDSQRGAMMESARRAMYNMDDAARSLAARSRGALFDYRRFGRIQMQPAVKVGAAAGAMAPDAAQLRTRKVEEAQAIGAPLRAVLNQLATASMGEHVELARRMGQRLDTMTHAFEAIDKGT